MDDFSSRQRAARPESAASSRTQTSRLTPTSSNNSSANLTFRGASSGSLLQERLRERKVRRGSVDLSDRGVQSSPVRGTFSKDERRPNSSGKGMGVKQMEDQVSTLHKQNFDLKLELFHRRQRQEKLEEMLAAAEKRVEEQAELQEVNEELLEELEKRDQALDEAVGLIVTLEDKIARLMDERAGVRAYDEQAYQENQESAASSVPPLAPSKLLRMPSFLSEKSEGTEALRSLYLPLDGSLPRLSEEGMPDAMDSPRLSVLSESSFVSVYGEKKIPQLSLDDDLDMTQRHRASSNTEKWVDERPVPTRTPLRPAGKSQYLSLNDVIASPLQRLEKLQAKIEKLPSLNTRKSSYEPPPQALPPTPDTFSTSTLQSKRNFTSSTETLHKNAMMSYPNQSTISIRPRSAGETVTSRRDGHGWDTPTETNTDAGSVVSAISNSYRHNIMAPNLFSFAPGEWGRDVMFNREPAPPVPTHRRLRRSSVGEEIKSDGKKDKPITRYSELLGYGTSPIDTTPKPELPDRRSSLNAAMKTRRSHHSSTNGSNSPSSTRATGSTGSNTTSPTKRSRISSSFGIFRRSEASPLSNVQSSPAPAPKPAQNTRSYTYSDSSQEDEPRISATPPPIRRNRTTSYRPDSAGTGANKERSLGFDGADVAMLAMGRDIVSEKREARRERRDSATVVTKEAEEKDEGGKGRIGKWLSLGGSALRRN